MHNSKSLICGYNDSRAAVAGTCITNQGLRNCHVSVTFNPYYQGLPRVRHFQSLLSRVATCPSLSIPYYITNQGLRNCHVSVTFNPVLYKGLRNCHVSVNSAHKMLWILLLYFLVILMHAPRKKARHKRIYTDVSLFCSDDLYRGTNS